MQTYGIYDTNASEKFVDPKLFVETPDSVKDRLALWAKLKYGSLKEVARMAGLNYSHLTQINDEKLPSGKITMPLAKLGLNINWWLTGEGPMDAPKKGRRIYPEEAGPSGDIVGTITIGGQTYRIVDEDGSPDDEDNGNQN